MFYYLLTLLFIIINNIEQCLFCIPPMTCYPFSIISHFMYLLLTGACCAFVLSFVFILILSA